MANEQRLIDSNDVKMREKLMKIVCDGLEDGCVGHCNFPHCYRVNNVADQLIANDVVPIVRCKDCKSSDYSGCSGGMVYCMEHACYMDENGYCSDGKSEVIDNAAG